MRHHTSILLASLFLLGWTLLAEEAIHTSKVIGPEFPGKYKHPASFTELENGDLYLVYYGGSGEYQDDSKVWGMRKAAGGERWTTPQVVADTPFKSEGNPVVWQAPNGWVWLFYVQRYGETWSESRIKAKISYDGAQTWSDSYVINFEQGMMVRSHPIVLHNGDYLLGVYHETAKDREKVGKDTTSVFLRYQPESGEWIEQDRVYSRLGNLQPSMVEVTDNYLVSYSRRGGGYEPSTDGWLVRAESRDGGRTWTNGLDSQFPNPNAATDFKKLKNGHLVLVYNDNMSDRTPLTVAISVDGDKTYPYRRNIAEGNVSLAYPVVIQTRDEKIHVIYTTRERTQIMHAVFDEEAIVK